MRKSIERQRNIIDFALSSMLRRKVKNLSLALLYTLIIFICASLIFFIQAIKREASTLLVEAPDIVVQRLMAGRHDLIPDAYGKKIAEIRGISDVRPRLWGYYYDPVFGANYTVMARDGEETAQAIIAIGQGVARNQRVREGDMLTLRGASGTPLLLTVGTILPLESEILAADLILMSTNDFRALFGIPAGQATDLAITVANPREQVIVAGKIAEKFPDTRPILKSEILRTYDSIFDWRGGMMVIVIAVAILAFVIFAWDKASGLSAEERREIGILKSIGWETGDILLLKFWEGITVSLTAFMGGVLLAYCHVFLFSAPLFAQAMKGWSVLYPKFRLTPHVDAYQLTILFFLTVLPYTISTIVPSWLAATVDADTAMRS
jgi:ABC-type lipoprotein release transport system permease subunit